MENKDESTQKSDSGWRPISSAPRVFSPPLSFYNHHAPQILGLWGQAFYSVCSWGGPSQPYWIDCNNKKIPFQPTRWMPLPEAPFEIGIEPTPLSGIDIEQALNLAHTLAEETFPQDIPELQMAERKAAIMRAWRVAGLLDDPVDPRFVELLPTRYSDQ